MTTRTMATLDRPTVRHGRLSAFHQFVSNHQDMVYNVTYRILGDEGLATRVTQETFSRSFGVFSELRGESARLWLMRIVANLCHDRLLRGPPSCQQPPAGGDPFQECLSVLSPEQRITLVLSDVQGLSYSEIAEVTGVPVAVVRSRLNRGRTGLRDALLARNAILFEGRP